MHYSYPPEKSPFAKKVIEYNVHNWIPGKSPHRSWTTERSRIKESVRGYSRAENSLQTIPYSGTPNMSRIVQYRKNIIGDISDL